jgi:3-oxoadipate enol-lactonase
MPKIRIKDVDLFYEFRGNAEGPTLVFVNGLLTDTSSWERHLPYFAERYRCLVYDCRGQGQSDKPDHVYTTSLHAADLAGLVEALGIERAHFVGLSNGGAALLHLAADHPERVQALVISGAYAYADTILKVKLTSWIRAMEAGGSPARFDVATPWVWGGGFLEKNYEGLLSFREKGVNLPTMPVANLIRGAMEQDARGKLARIAAPMLVIVGEEDVLTPPKLARAIVKEVPGARLHVMEGLGHASALEDVEGFSRVVLGFLEDVEAVRN